MLPADALGRLGVNVTPLPLLTADEATTLQTGSLAACTKAVLAARRRLRAELGSARDADVVLVQRQIDPLPSRGIERRAIAGRALVLDVDDAIWLPQPGRRPLGVVRGDAAKLRWLCARADHVIAGNDYLAEWLSRHARVVSVVPSLVDTAKIAPRVHREADTLTLGWIGSHSTVRYLHAIVPALTAFARAHADVPVRLVVVGGEAPVIEGMRTEQWRWSEERESAALAQMDIGLMPLPDNAWTRGKCAYKALQYMAAGVPVVADDVGVTATVVGDGSAGSLVRRPEEWPAAIQPLANDVELRQRMGAAGRSRVVDRFSVDVWAPRLARLIAGAC